MTVAPASLRINDLDERLREPAFAAVLQRIKGE